MGKNTHESDVAFIKALAELLRENDLSELEVSRDYGEDDALNVRVARQAAVAVPVAAPAPVAAAPVAAAPVAAAPSPQADADPALDPGAVTSPMVGTAYLAPEPGAATFVNVGDQVSEGQTILIIEAMKTMNQIPASADGVVSSIAVEDGQPVEFGETLITLD